MAVREKYAHLPSLGRDIRERLAQLPERFRRYPVQAAYLFGSAAQNPDSANDIDLAIVPDQGYSFLALYAELSLWLGTDRIDLVDLPAAPYWLQETILRTGVRLYTRDACAAARYEAGVLSLCVEQRVQQRRLTRDARQPPMDIDREFVQQVVFNLRRVAEELDNYARVSGDALATNLSLRWTVEHGLQTGITRMLQAAQHILTRRFGTLPDSYEGALAELRAQGVISAALYRRLRGAGGFRNVLVHEYLQVDRDRVARFARRAPKLFRDCAEELARWLDTA
ncbi:MAG: HepT-like ribonuclease domain-containing protein [Fimbriimonadales bacterium]|nr:MAG: hypothetical protein KatS3mg018_0667 [Fimbriimonadales bacterium]